MSDWLHPAWPYLGGALCLPLVPAPARRVVLLAAPLLAVALAWGLPDGGTPTVTILGQELTWLRVDPLARAFALVFAVIGGLGALYGLGSGSLRLGVAGFVASAAGLGIVLAGDWITLYVAWELLALASFALVTDGGTAAARRAAYRYLLVHATGGALLLGGIAWHQGTGGSALVTALAPTGPGLLILLGFAVNAALPPLHAWLPDAYPESSPGAGVILSAFATKAAVYALARVFGGTEALVLWGVAMALYGVVFAMLENDIRRLLGYHIVSQVGYMVAGVGLGTPLALSGAVAHAFCHIIYKGLLFMGTGAVIHATGRRKLTELGGLGPLLPATFVLYMVGALSISGAPLLNGFVSKSMVVAAADAEQRFLVARLLDLASVGTFLSVGLKLPYFAFAGPLRTAVGRAVPPTMLTAMGLAAALSALIGVAPGVLYGLLPFPVTYRPYTTAHVLESLELLTGTALGFVLLRRQLGAKNAITLDSDRLWRALGRGVATVVAPVIARGADLLETAAGQLVSVPVEGQRPGLRVPLGYGVLLAVLALGAVLLLG